jgi:hypothetical protein
MKIQPDIATQVLGIFLFWTIELSVQITTFFYIPTQQVVRGYTGQKLKIPLTNSLHIMHRG